MRTAIILTLALLQFTSLMAGDLKKDKFTFTPYGYIAFETMVDTRLSAVSRTGHVYLYPLRPEYNAEGVDINDASKFNYGISISRIGSRMTGPEAFGAKTSAVIEIDFAGLSDVSDFLVPRLRHFYASLQWDTRKLTLGQTWHPFFITENSPNTVNFVAGSPVHPLSRGVQAILGQQVGKRSTFILSTFMQSDFKSVGPSEQVELANIPEIIAQYKYKHKGLFMSAGIGVKQQRPLNPETTVTVNNLVTSKEANLSFRYDFGKFYWSLEGIYGESMSHLTMLGGLAQKAKNGVAIEGEYTPIKVASLWTDMETNEGMFRVGAFAGVTRNLGSIDESVPADGYARGSDIGYQYIVAPRLYCYSGPLRIGLEWMYSVAAYNELGSYNEYSKPTNLSEVANNRFTLSAKYFF